jgi:DNA-binding CsgD family transcriptional regulator
LVCARSIVAAVREIAAGGNYMHPALGARMVAAEAQERAAAEADPLSEREHEILRLLALGHTNHEIAEQLYISVRTAESHRAHIMQKLRLSTRAELVRYALSHGLLADDAARALGAQADAELVLVPRPVEALVGDVGHALNEVLPRRQSRGDHGIVDDVVDDPFHSLSLEEEDDFTRGEVCGVAM